MRQAFALRGVPLEQTRTPLKIRRNLGWQPSSLAGQRQMTQLAALI